MSTHVNMVIKQLINKDGVPFEVVNPRLSKALLAFLQEIEDYKIGKVELESYKDVKALRKVLIYD